MKMEIPELSTPWITLKKVAKISIILNIVLIVFIIGLGIAIFSLFPLKEKVPVFVEFKEGTNNFVKIHAAGEILASNKQLIRYWLRHYVDIRETVDKTTEKDTPDGRKGRYNKVLYLSSKEVGKEFILKYLKEDTGLFFKPFFKRSVKIISDSFLGEGVHLLEIETTDTLTTDPRIRDVRSWTVTLSYEFNNQVVNYDDGLLNPLGIFITEYSIVRKTASPKEILKKGNSSKRSFEQ